MTTKRLIYILLITILLSGCQSHKEAIPEPVSTSTFSLEITNSPLPPTQTQIVVTSTLASTQAIPSATPAVTSTFTLVPTPTPTPQDRLAYLENGQITIRDLSGQQSSIVEGQYRQILGWSAHQNYLLALRQDGASAVIDTAGNTQAVFEHLPQPAQWGRDSKGDISEDWLAVVRPDAALELTSFPSRKSELYIGPDSLGQDKLTFVRWGSDGSAILSSYQDSQKQTFQVLDNTPGSTWPIWIGFLNKELCSSCAADGLELNSQDPQTGRTIPLGIVMLNTSEAYAWNPAQPGLLALAVGGSRFTLENKRLALLDVPAGTPPRYLSGKDQVGFEPSWSPDGRRLAYTVLPAQAQVSGSGQEMEALLSGRAIAVYDLITGTTQTLTHPAKDEIDGWPRWSVDGKRLLFARKRLADATTQVWQHDQVTGEEQLIITISNAPQSCHRIGCGWDQMLAYAPGQSAAAPVALAPILAPTATPNVQADTPRQGMMTYHNTAYGFSFQYPSTWTLGGVGELPNYIKLTSAKGELIIGYRRANQQAGIQRTGVGSGDFVHAGSIQFMGKTLQRDRLVYGGKTKEVFYQGDAEFQVGNLVFTLGLDYNGFRTYEDADIPLDVQKEADKILESFQLDGTHP